MKFQNNVLQWCTKISGKNRTQEWREKISMQAQNQAFPGNQIKTFWQIHCICQSCYCSSYQMVPTCMYYPQPHPCFNWPWRASGPGHRWACTSIARLAILYAPNIVRDHVYFSLLARQVSWIMPPPHACYQGPETGIICGCQLSITHFYDTFRRPCLGVWEK